MNDSLLQQIDDDIWILDGGIVPFYGCPYPTRSVVVRLPSGELWIWSPVALSPKAKAVIEVLGAPAHLVSPNKIHHLFLKDWADAWPRARLWGPLTTIRKRPDLNFESPLDDTVPSEWGDVLELVRFSGSPFMDEIVFFHRPSQTTILADLSEHFSEEFLRSHWKPWQRWIAQLWGIVEGKGFAPLEWRLSFFDRNKARQARDKILSWPSRRVVMAHGVWQRDNGQAFLQKALAWV